jgi:hypothetical protein
LGEKEISKLLAHLTNKSIRRFVNDLSEPVVNLFQENFINLNFSTILEVTFETYGTYNNQMHMLTQRKCWSEVLKLTLYEYIKNLLTTGSKKIKDKNELMKRIESDRENIMSSYESLLGENTIKECLKIIDDFLSFLDCSSQSIGYCCSKIREYNGSSFTLTMAKALINLRTDFDKNEKSEAISACKDILTDFRSTFSAERENCFEFGNIDEEINDDEEKTEKIASPKKDGRRNTMNIFDFLKSEENELKKEKDVEEDKAYDDIGAVRVRAKSRVAVKVDSDVIMQGMMQKKSYS